MSEIICSKLINRHHNNPLVGHFRINKTRELKNIKYFWLTLRQYINAYLKGYSTLLAIKTIQYKLYRNFQSLLIATHHYQNLVMDFIVSLPLLVDRKNNNYDTILVIINWLIKMVYYKVVKTTINVLELAEMISNIVVTYYSLLKLIIIERGLLLNSKFRFSLYYFLCRHHAKLLHHHPSTNR